MNLTSRYLMYMVEFMGGAWYADPLDGRGKLPLPLSPFAARPPTTHAPLCDFTSAIS
jgi:hypothetical protein